MKTSLAVPAPVDRILEILHEQDHPAYLVGGCVRDCLLDKKPHDWDICTSAGIAQIRPVFEEKGYYVAATGLKHGTLTVIDNGRPYEITVFRKKSDFAAIHGKKTLRRKNETSSLREDLELRDFTINSIAWSPQEGIVDPFGGVSDLQKGVLRCAGSAKDRLTEDPLRILRALRFSALLGFSINEELKAAMHETVPLLEKVAVERITSELYRFMHASGVRVAALLREYADVFCFIMPELKPMIGFDQHNFHHSYDVWEHTMKAMEACKVEDIVLKFTILFHDMGKPAAFTMDAEGIGHFYGHGEISRQLCSVIMKRLRFDTKTASEVRTLVEVHDARVEGNTRSIRRWLNRLGLEQFERLLLMKTCDAAGQNPAFWPEREAYINSLRAGLQEVLAKDSCFSLKDLVVKGSDLIAVGYQTGGVLGKCLQRLLDEVLDERLPNEKDALLATAVSWLNQEARLR
ncbi:MAG: CCA tRNA nucleotidyltransferase [Bacteroides sp.]|nr:CCA tRNA nucleotidyltransferase [Ruminococcus flavefaciens]MCM1554518.1 CCA tRNA nucleotidyltransferase [Bacteroides sp.]